jgi:TonB-linked SusC/RagA family outer membrane protein
METMLGKHSFPNRRPHRLWAVGLSFLMAVMLIGGVHGTAFGQEISVTGTVTEKGGFPLRGVTVRVTGSEATATTNAYGRYTILAPSNGELTFTLIGQKPGKAAINGRTTVDITLDRISFLEEVVVTAYSESQKRSEITGAVSGVNVETVQRQTGASVLQRIDVTVPGVTVDASGSPGSRSTVRIRGVSSFQNNDPLYIVDGVALQDSYINWLNPNDIQSIQVLKDASAASIYGARASNGVVIIETTKRGASGPPKTTVRVRSGIASPARGYDDFLMLNALDYYNVVKTSYLNAGYPIDSVPSNVFGNPNSPSVPNYIWPNNCGPKESPGVCNNVDPNSYSYPGNLIMPGSNGTNWWKEVFHPAYVGDYNIDVAGGSRDNAYLVSANYYDQNGTARYNRFGRGSLRVNTNFNRNKWSFGENLAVSTERAYGGLPDDPGTYAEDGILGKNILMQPVVPVRDIAGNFASGKAVGLGNQSNPLKFAFAHKDDINRNDRLFGTLFAGYDINPRFAFRTRLGFNRLQGSFTQYNPITPENSEPQTSNSILENQRDVRDWGWNNTLKYIQQFDKHGVSVLVGQEISKSTNRFVQGQMNNLISTDVNSRYLQDALGDASTKTVFSNGGESALLSFFGKADYNYANRYIATFTLRQDGSSNLGPDHRWGTFPAVGLGWRLSQESFMRDNKTFSDLMLRFGWGITGNQTIPSGRIVSQFGGDRGDTYYDVTGSNSSVQAGYRLQAIGNKDLKWEENNSVNVGADLTLFSGKVDLVVDVYQRKTNNLLFDPPTPATAGVADPPIVNIGKMKNTGIDFSIGHRSTSWSVNLNGSHYKNEIESIDGDAEFFYGPITTRYGNQVINQVGQPIGSFYGLMADGFFRDAADVAAHAKQDGAAPGRIKFRDVNGDGQVTLADRTIIGNPHPSFTSGLDVGLYRGAWDLTATVFGSFGNDIFDVQKEFYVFRNFSTNVRKDLLSKSWTPENPNAKYPRLDINDNYSHAISSYYVEDGSYVRLRSVQLGYNVPSKYVRWLQATRVYLQAENLFTITGYDGLDPSLPAANVTGPAGDIRDQYRGIDRGSYPSNRMFSIGLITSF